MATLISVYNSGGLVGRCDAKCHDATGPDCDCICGGMNHGAGAKQAQDNTRQYAEKWIEAIEDKTGLKVDIPAKAPQQKGLFDHD